jgi:hypothetical protein
MRAGDVAKDNDDEAKIYNRLLEKYQKSNKHEIHRLTSNGEWIFSWLSVDLDEWERTESLKYGLWSRRKFLHIRDRILKIREQLAHLQTQTVRHSAY